LVADFNVSSVANTVSFFNGSQNATTYNWSFGDGNSSTQINPAHTYLSSGTFQVTLIASDSVCGIADTVVKTVSVTTSGLFSPGSSNVLNVSPNPVFDILTFISSKKVSSLQVFTTDGRLILNTNKLNLSDEEYSLNVAMLSSGIYFLKIYNDELESSCIKFTKY